MENVNCDICGSDANYEIYVAKNVKYDANFSMVKCRNCGLIYCNPRLEKSELEKAYDDASYFESIIHNPERMKGEQDKYETRLDLLEKYAEKGRLLSVGCGLGFDLGAALKRGWEVHGFDVSKYSYEFCKKRYGIEILIGDIEDLNFSEEFFDVVTLWDSLEHLPSPSIALKIINNWLRKDGLLIMRMPNIDGLFPRILYPFSRMIGEWRHPEPPLHLYEFGRGSISKLLDRTGFQVIEILSDEAPIDYLVQGSKHPVRMKIIARLLYPIARMMKSGNAMIVIAKKI